MLHEFAIEPEALARWGVLWQALEQFGVSQGRMISQFPRHWKRLVYQATGVCQPVERSKLEIRLSQLDDKLISPVPRSYDGNVPWRDNARREMASQPFRAVIQADNPAGEEWVLTDDDLHRNSPRWQVPRELPCDRQPLIMAGMLTGLCGLSSEILFVDPHFGADKRFTEVLIAILNVLGPSPRRIKRIEYHVGIKIPRPHLEAGCQKWVQPRLPKGVSIKFHLWEERTLGEKFHARYVLTERGGIRFDVGLDSGDAGQTTDLSLLDVDLHSQRWQQFQISTAAFDLIDHFTIVAP